MRNAVWTLVLFSAMPIFENQDDLNWKRTIGVIRASCSTGNSCVIPVLWLRTPCFHVVRDMRCGDRSGQFCGSPRPIRRPGNCSFVRSVLCRLKCGLLRHAEVHLLSCFVSSKSSLISVCSSVTLGCRFHIRMTLLIGNDLRNYVMNYSHEVILYAE